MVEMNFKLTNYKVYCQSTMEIVILKYPHANRTGFGCLKTANSVF